MTVEKTSVTKKQQRCISDSFRRRNVVHYQPQILPRLSYVGGRDYVQAELLQTIASIYSVRGNLVGQQKLLIQTARPLHEAIAVRRLLISWECEAWKAAR